MKLLTNENALKKAIVEIPKGDERYPSAWRGLTDSPERLYAVGDISLLGGRKIGVVGSRRTPASALKVGGEIVGRLSKSLTVVTGAADGGDTAALRAALKEGGKVICLLAGGFSALPQYNVDLLEEVAKGGLLLSLHPFEMPVRSFSYEYRNKLLAHFCEGVFVLGAGEKSGALTTARYAKGLNLPLFALPYPPNSTYGSGCNQLIKQGARLVESAEDIAYPLGVDLEEKASVELTAEEERVYRALKEGESHVNELVGKTGVPVFKLRAVLSALEVKGVAVSVGGNRYAAV